MVRPALVRRLGPVPAGAHQPPGRGLVPGFQPQRSLARHGRQRWFDAPVGRSHRTPGPSAVRARQRRQFGRLQPGRPTIGDAPAARTSKPLSIASFASCSGTSPRATNCSRCRPMTTQFIPPLQPGWPRPRHSRRRQHGAPLDRVSLARVRLPRRHEPGLGDAPRTIQTAILELVRASQSSADARLQPRTNGFRVYRHSLGDMHLPPAGSKTQPLFPVHRARPRPARTRLI